MGENQLENQEAAVPAAGAAQMPRKLSPIYRRVRRDVLGAPPILSQAYLDELKLSGVIFGGGELEGRYRVEAARPGDRVCYLNLDHPHRPELALGERGDVHRQRFLNRASVAPSQLHPNAWSAIRCFELVTDSLKLPQDPEVFLYLFTLFSPNTEGKTKKGYMSVRPGKYRKIFGLYEDSFHDFKGHFFKIFPISKHRPFWLSLEGQGRFPPYWSLDGGMDYVPVTYKTLNADQKDTADILVKLFFERNLKPKTVLSNPSEAREAIVDMAGKEVTLERLRRLIRPGSSQTVPAPISASGNIAFPEGGGSSNVGGAEGPIHEVSSPVLGETLPSSPSSPQVQLGKRPAGDATAEPKRPRFSEGTNREFCSMDRSFDASGFIASNLLGPRAQWEGRCVKLNGDLKALNLQRIEAKKEKLVAEHARVKAEGDLKSLSRKLEALEREKIQEAERRKDREAELEGEIQELRKSVSEEKARADKAEASLAESERGREELVRIAKDSVVATERALKHQVSLLLPEFDVSQLGAFKVIVDGKIVDLPE
ncbi:hypothetical protein PIB30_008964 [Stylosanthes scabra]|uniref:Uncharacterized protein n=1 Tax=Stylosanthes scabra TaxID=79078 RepID=A0ABU6S5R7_9FABA|nr:hypothetical protein [Stylosanthes scabra]